VWLGLDSPNALVAAGSTASNLNGAAQGAGVDDEGAKGVRDRERPERMITNLGTRPFMYWRSRAVRAGTVRPRR
jgi:hypothetical protein